MCLYKISFRDCKDKNINLSIKEKKEEKRFVIYINISTFAPES